MPATVPLMTEANTSCGDNSSLPLTASPTIATAPATTPNMQALTISTGNHTRALRQLFEFLSVHLSRRSSPVTLWKKDSEWTLTLKPPQFGHWTWSMGGVLAKDPGLARPLLVVLLPGIFMTTP